MKDRAIRIGVALLAAASLGCAARREGAGPVGDRAPEKPPASAERAPSAPAIAPTATPETAATAPPAATVPPAAPAIEPRAVVRFACDEKYETEAPCDVAAWMNEVAKNPWSSNLLDHHDAGPEGAIWNGNATMFVIARESVHGASMGNTALGSVVASGFRWFRVPYKTWQRALRDVPRRPYQAAVIRVDGAAVGAIWRAEGE